ncbi:MAG: BNR-4 repeat-containing protein [Anaerolineae bacterium]|nr:BNR-4 repeat-containing protein [Anaerolineae bacterium]
MDTSMSQTSYRRNPVAGQDMPDPVTQEVFCTKADSYIGMWHKQGSFFPTYGPKYGGGLGTYNAKHRPLAIYAPEVNKTFFCWGGARPNNYRRDRYVDFEQGNLLHMISYYDHTTGKVPRPTIVFDKWCGDPHDNPVLQLDKDGYLWLFSPSHGSGTTRSFIHRSVEPYTIDRWETISDAPLFAYPQPWYDPDKGFFFMHTCYHLGRGLHFKSSRDGITWTEPVKLAHICQGHYQVTAFNVARGVIGTAFNYHPDEGGLERRTNLYYIQTPDWGQTWTAVTGQPLTLPLTEVKNPALIWDAEAEGLKVYMKDIVFDTAGHPIIVCVTSRGYEPGPQNGPHTWRFIRWTGTEWVRTAGIVSDNNYDMGAFYLEADGWRLIAPTEPGPQPYNPGGEVALWESKDEGIIWTKLKQLTHNSPRNHTYVRRPLNAHPDFYAFWADGNARAPSISYLYFTNRNGDHVWQLPVGMTTEYQKPEIIC